MKRGMTIIAKTIIAIPRLRAPSDYRMIVRMSNHSSRLIDDLGGTSEVARLIEAPISTVHSWRRIGIPRSRLAHLKLAAQAAGKQVDWDRADETAEQEAA